VIQLILLSFCHYLLPLILTRYWLLYPCDLIAAGLCVFKELLVAEAKAIAWI